MIIIGAIIATHAHKDSADYHIYELNHWYTKQPLVFTVKNNFQLVKKPAFIAVSKDKNNEPQQQVLLNHEREVFWRLTIASRVQDEAIAK